MKLNGCVKTTRVYKMNLFIFIILITILGFVIGIAMVVDKLNKKIDRIESNLEKLLVQKHIDKD